jgi:hypothetical protein
MPESDQEIFEHFRSDYRDSSREIALLAYARYAQDKYDWVNQKLKKDGRVPTENEIARWISELPNSRLSEIHNGAINMFSVAAEEYMKPRMEDERARAVERSILGQVAAMAQRVERATSFRTTVFPNLVIGVVASFVFALIVLICAVIFRRDLSIFAPFK